MKKPEQQKQYFVYQETGGSKKQAFHPLQWKTKNLCPLRGYLHLGRNSERLKKDLKERFIPTLAQNGAVENTQIFCSWAGLFENRLTLTQD